MKILIKIKRKILRLIYNQITKASLHYPFFDSLHPAIDSANIFYNKNNINEKDSICIDIGSGRRPRNIFNSSKIIGLDFTENEEEGVIYCDLSSGNLPFENNSISFITAFDFIEHLSRTQIKGSSLNPFINLMNEIYRVLKPGGIFLSHTPAFPFSSAFQDPTHTNFISEMTFPGYFAKDVSGRWTVPWAQQYGFKGEFTLVNQYWLNEHLITVLGKS
jgi:SAM-dependent methyltransferase